MGEFYELLERGLKIVAEKLGEKNLFCGDPGLQLSPNEIDLGGAKPVLCLKTALAACETIVTQGEGAREDQTDSHFNKFIAIRAELAALKQKNPDFIPAHPGAHNPVLRRPPTPEGKVWVEDGPAAAIVDIANAAYQLMLRLIAYTYSVPGPDPEKGLAVDLGVDLMKAMSLLGESAARRPAGPSNPGCNAGVSFTALRDAAPLPHAASSRRFFTERLNELADGAAKLDLTDARLAQAAKLLRDLADRATKQFAAMKTPPVGAAPVAEASVAETKKSESAANRDTPPTNVENGVETVEGKKITIIFNGKKCIHSRFCVTGAPRVFLANVEGPWIHPDDMDAEELAAIARECPSGAIQYKRNDGQPEEHAPPVNLARVTEGGPYWLRGDLRIDGESVGARATLEIVSGTGRMVARVQTCRLCRCGHSNTKPFCDGTHAKIGFKSGD